MDREPSRYLCEWLTVQDRWYIRSIGNPEGEGVTSEQWSEVVKEVQRLNTDPRNWEIIEGEMPVGFLSFRENLRRQDPSITTPEAVHRYLDRLFAGIVQ
ncbi:hypothetical protein HY386_01940 [Candidatus Daviesbacteria bacterium]|nr:hypothetical protein [Candidatus Daviesbacteria bacterium]